ncbi:unnamed protein product [Paramecium sonneborni]|uniref:Uncharacterized protein n=1 Tax=Paramecium sonneborni TaxID=65129 RepID=A0A8S1MTN3_9CILI|nr:unnamed protein product [Paramecium sonneborni]
MDQLNSWGYCNPTNWDDKLPKPYKFINKILNKMILNEVYNKVFEIEKYRSDPNYEGQLRTLPPQGVFDIPQLSCVSRDSSSNLVAAGDTQGNLMILDLSKKLRIAKKETNGKRIVKVCLSNRDEAIDDYKNVCVIGVVQHNDPIVSVYRFRPLENKLLLHHTITLSKDKNTIGEYPVDVDISQYSQYITVTQYNGSVKVFRIPDLKIDQQSNSSQISNNSVGAQSPRHIQSQFKPSPIKGKEQPIVAQVQQQQIQTSPMDIVCSELTDLIYYVKFDGIKKTLDYNGIIAKIKQDLIVPKEAPPEEKLDPKKKGAPAPKKAVEMAPVTVVEEILYEENDNGAQPSDDDYPEQKFRAIVEFITERFSIQNGNKTFNSYKQHECVTGIVVGWTNTKRLELHRFTSAKRSALPEYLSASFGLPSQQLLKQQPIITEVQIIYPLSCIAISKSSVYLAAGLQQGSVFVYDLILEQERFYLDKHMYNCTQIQFCDDNRLVSSSYDGGVNIYDLKDGKLLCKRTHQFRKGTKVKMEEQKQGFWRIIGMSVSHTGVAAALDAQQEVRIYDVWHGEKIAKLSPQQVMDDKLRSWVNNKALVSCYKNEILISADVLQVNQYTTLQIFKIFDNLVNIFPGLANIYRKGIEKDKVMNLFEKIPKNELQNPQFDIPNLQGNGNNQLRIPGQERRPSQQRGSQHRGSQQRIGSQHGSHKSSKLPPAVPPSIKGGPISLINSLHKSNHSDQQVDFNSSFKSYQASSMSHRLSKQNSKQAILTKEMLHPEQFLLEKDKTSMPLLIKEDTSMVEHCRSRNSERLVRIEKVNSMIQKVGQQLAQEEEKKKLQERHRQLSSAK